jgi:hypothetical protein
LGVFEDLSQGGRVFTSSIASIGAHGSLIMSEPLPACVLPRTGSLRSPWGARCGCRLAQASEPVGLSLVASLGGNLQCGCLGQVTQCDRTADWRDRRIAMHPAVARCSKTSVPTSHRLTTPRCGGPSCSQNRRRLPCRLGDTCGAL